MWIMNFQMFKLDFKKADQIVICCIIKKSRRVPGKCLFLLYWLCQSIWLCGSQQIVENSLRDGNTRPSDLCPEKSVHRSRNNSQIWTWNNRLVPNGKVVCQGCILSPCLFNLYVEYMRNARLEEAQAGIKIGGRNINNLRYADGTTLMAESKEELKSLLMKMKKLI